MNESNEIKFLKAKVALLETEKKHLIQKVADLKKKESEAPHNILPSRINTPLSVSAESSSDYSIEQKIQLLKNVFRGREDVHACYWISKKTGKRGYSPVCKNEWVRNICKKPAIKCSACPSRELSPLTDDVIKKHLEGMCSVGIYPMLPEETCYFLAVDFDGEGWVDNIGAFKETCSQKNIPVTIERSKSGNGAHAWIFFDEKIPAALARRMGSFLIIVYKKIESYDLNYRDKKGNPRPVKFISYIWKRIDGFIIDSLKKEIKNISQVKENT